MSARAKATISAVTSSCASPSRWGPWRARSPPRSPATLANRPALQKPRQKADRGEQRVPPLPRLQRNGGPRMAVDFPRDVIRPARERRGRLGETEHRQGLAGDPPPAPTAFRTAL